MVTLAIEHVEASAPPSFRVTRQPNPKSTEPVPLRSPYEFPVEGTPKHLMAGLRWYLEDFLRYPFEPETVRAEHVLDALKGWGGECFNALFDNRDAGKWLESADILQIRSDDPHVLSWPWEALYDTQAGAHIALQRRIERRLNELPDPPEAIALPSERVNILLVVARPYENDVSYRSIARPLIELIESKNLPAHVDVLRPPTFDQLREHLRTRPGYYHVLHFDGHGSYGNSGGQYSPHQFQARQGSLVFETDKGEADPKSARDLSALLRDYAVPAAVLNACQAATLDEEAEDAFASVATALLQSGTRSVVAMAYSLYVSGAQVFLPAFYRRLFETGNVAEAGRAGRQEMLANKKRTSARGPYPLEDWLLPVVYQQDPLDFSFAQKGKPEKRQSRLPQEVVEHREEYGFIGRDGPVLRMERALHRQAPCILIQGLGGVGKTTLARGFLRWLNQTGGLDGALWFDFRDIRTAEYVIDRTGELFYGENFRLAKNKLELLAEALGAQRVVMVWDNFESAAQNLTTDDRSQLGQFLDAIRGKRSKVILTSRLKEEWLGPARRMEVWLRGLEGEERWEYCEAILENLGLKVNRNDPGLSRLMDQLAGHPLAMRVVLPRLERTDAGKVSEALRKNIAALGLNAQEEQGRLFGTLRFVEEGLDPELRPLLDLVALHESYLNAALMEEMAKQVDAEWTRERIERLMAALGSAGLMREIGQSAYEMHPLLTSYLRSRGQASEACQRSFVDIIGSFADSLAPKPWHEQRGPFLLYGPNIHLALTLSQRLDMDQAYLALTWSPAIWAQNSRNFAEASHLFMQLAQDAVVRNDSRNAASAYHQLGTIAQEEREFGTAGAWYLKSLAISEKQGNLHEAAITYHQLGRIAQEEREFGMAGEWYLKSLAIEEKEGNLHGAAITYHQLGRIAEEEREFETAREWYLKSLAIKEKQGDLHGAAITYHELGVIAAEERDFGTARDWYLKSLAISEEQGNLHGAAIAYHQLGVIAGEEGEFAMAREWYLKSLAISEKQGNLHRAAMTYGQLGRIAREEGEFAMAREWYLKSLAIKEKQGNLHGAAIAYHQLGRIAEEEREFGTAREWYLKSLAIEETQGNSHGGAITYYQVGLLSFGEDRFAESGRWLIQALAAFLRLQDNYRAQIAGIAFLRTLQHASAEERETLKSMWKQADLGPFPNA